MGIILGPDGQPYDPNKKPEPPPEPAKLEPKETPRSTRKQVNQLIHKLNKARIPSFFVWWEDGKFHINCSMAKNKGDIKTIINNMIDTHDIGNTSL